LINPNYYLAPGIIQELFYLSDHCYCLKGQQCACQQGSPGGQVGYKNMLVIGVGTISHCPHAI
jgi:hypothetical protein